MSAKTGPRDTQLDPQVSEGEITVTDPRHPLYGKSLKLTGFTFLRGHIRHCQVEIHSGRVDYVPLASTNLSTEPRPEPTVLTAAAIEELVRAFQAFANGRRCNQPFDLGLANIGGKTLAGNCDLCFLKSAGTISAILRSDQSLADWWMRMEQEAEPSTPLGVCSCKDRLTYRRMRDAVLAQQNMDFRGRVALAECFRHE